MIFTDRLEFLDQCIAGEQTLFRSLLSKEVFNTFDKGYDLYRDHIKQKNSITNVTCEVSSDHITFHLKSKKNMEDIISDNIPKRGITPVETENGVDLNIMLIDLVTL